MNKRIIIWMFGLLLLSSFVSAFSYIPANYYPLETNGVDVGTNEFGLGGSVTSYGSVKIGNGAKLVEGSSNYLSNETGGLTSPSSIKTIDLWVNTTSLTDFQRYLFIGADSSPNGFDFFQDNTDKFLVRIYNGGVTWTTSAFGTATVNDLQHFIFSQNATHWNFYIDGSLATSVSSTDGILDSFPSVYLGKRADDTAYASAMIDNVAFFTQTYTSEDVAYSYNSGNGRNFSAITKEVNLTSPNNGTTINDNNINLSYSIDVEDMTIYTNDSLTREITYGDWFNQTGLITYHNFANILDGSGNGWDLTFTTTYPNLDTDIIKLGNASAFGRDSGKNALFDAGMTTGSDFTIGYWAMKFNGGGNDYLLDSATGRIIIDGGTAGGGLRFYDGAWRTFSYSDINFDEWNHFVWVKDGGNDIKLYVNGVWNETIVSASTSAIGGTTRLWDSNSGAGNPWGGWLDEFFISNRTLSEEEVSEIYNKQVNTTLLASNNSYNPTNCSLYIDSILNDTDIISDSNGNRYFNKNFNDGEYDWNVECEFDEGTISSDIWTFIIDTTSSIAVNNLWNSSIINNFNITINGTKYIASNGSVDVPLYGTYETLFESNNYLAILKNITLLVNETYNQLMYQTITTLNANEINTGNSIINWSIDTENGLYNSTTGSIEIYPNLGVYSWDWYNDELFFNQSNLMFNISEPYPTLNISNLYARNITFTDKYTSLTIAPSCTQDGFTYSSYDYLIHKSNSEFMCNLFGYEEYEITNNTFPDSNNYIFEPNHLTINFSEQVYGILQAGGTTPLEVENGNYTIATFNTTSFSIPQRNVSEGFAKITFNPDENGKFQQIFAYYNDLNTTIRDTILVQEIDLVQQIRISGQSQPLDTARVCAKYPNNNLYETTYCDFTDSLGDVNIQVNDQNTYLICVQAEGFESKCELHYIPPSNTEVITIDLTSTSSKSGFNYIHTDCRGIYNTNKTCNLDVSTYKPYYSICLNLTKEKGNINDSTYSCSYDSSSETFIYALNTDYEAYYLDVYLEGSLEKQLKHLNVTDEADKRINFESGNNNGQTILEKLKDNWALLVFIHILIMILGILAGMMFEKYFNGYGVYGVVGWFLFFSIGGFYIFWIPTIVGVVYFITERILPLFQN